MQTTRERIIEEALKSFLTEGYEKTSMNDLANALNISKPAIYHYFRNKQELLSVVQRFLLDIVNNAYAQVFQQEMSLKMTLEYLFSSVKDVQRIFQDSTGFNTDKFNYHRFFFDCSKYLPTDSLVEKAYREHKRLLTAKIRQAQEKRQISANLDADALSFQVIATLEGTYLLSLYLPSLELDVITQKMLSNVKLVLFGK